MKKHRHRWALILQDAGQSRRHCFGCNTTQRLISATKWAQCETAAFYGINTKTGELLAPRPFCQA